MEDAGDPMKGEYEGENLYMIAVKGDQLNYALYAAEKYRRYMETKNRSHMKMKKGQIEAAREKVRILEERGQKVDWPTREVLSKARRCEEGVEKYRFEPVILGMKEKRKEATT